jgi:RNA-binding protein
MGGLKGSQRRFLRGLAHGYRPIVQIGKEGLGENVIEAIDKALDAHELIKIKIAAGREERERISSDIEERSHCECVGMVGHMAILYREHPNPEKRRVQIP